MNQPNSVQIGVRLAPRIVEAIDHRVNEGYAINRADAVRKIIDKEFGIVSE